ncbi:Uncharacterized protein APZ42_012691 [Daphnia magna]|uniref:Uncharacterized protein n=1 Tax=Daphnia magna TaxID=35525 RepID=A0A162RKT8_9CRUS|nr:Uncharacterized protein APZ42_012691 [Daphnia magna]
MHNIIPGEKPVGAETHQRRAYPLLQPEPYKEPTGEIIEVEYIDSP